MNVTLSADHERLVRKMVEQGDFDSADALVAQALESWVRREKEDEAIRQRISKKIDRGIEQLARNQGLDGDKVFAELEAELDDLEKAPRAE